MNTHTIKPLLDALNERLEVTEAQFAGRFRSHGYVDDRYNNKPAIITRVRPEFHGLLNPSEDPFDQENELLGAVERAFADREDDSVFFWDETEFGQEIDADRPPVAVYLFDPDRLDELVSEIRKHPAVSDEERKSTRELLLLA